MATQIVAVRTAQPFDWQHAHITDVMTRERNILTRQSVIFRIESGWEQFFTTAGGEYADVVVRACPSCGTSDYITTTPDWTTANNLLSLPRF